MKRLIFLLTLFFTSISHGNDFFAKNSIFLEIGGSGLLYSINYDRIIGNYASSRIGLSCFEIYNGSIEDQHHIDCLLPVFGNFVLGKSSHHYEFGGGPIISNSYNLSTWDNDLSTLIGISLGYRYQPNLGGFFFRGGITPVLFPLKPDPSTWKGIIPWAGISIGYSFRGFQDYF